MCVKNIHEIHTTEHLDKVKSITPKIYQYLYNPQQQILNTNAYFLTTNHKYIIMHAILI
jgi:hypothetical protein